MYQKCCIPEHVNIINVYWWARKLCIYCDNSTRNDLLIYCKSLETIKLTRITNLELELKYKLHVKKSDAFSEGD